MSITSEFLKGFWKENPVLKLVLGLCPTLAVTTTLVNGLGMGMATTFVLVMSNLVVALIAGFIPKKVRIPCFIIVIASFVTIVDLVMHAWFFSLWESLGLFIPLIVVNCVILGRAEAFASKNGVFLSLADGLGMGLGSRRRARDHRQRHHPQRTALRTGFHAVAAGHPAPRRFHLPRTLSRGNEFHRAAPGVEPW
jgi:Na+-translocating ferredoxin:NAD+ oxidoreductase subunit E